MTRVHSLLALVRGFLNAFRPSGLARFAHAVMTGPGYSSRAAAGILAVSLSAPAAVLPPDAVIEGRTQAEWSAVWWEWAASYPVDISPLLDPDGRFAPAGDIGGSVFLLAPSPGDNIARTVNVPAGKYIFVPLLTFVTYGDPLDVARHTLDEQFSDVVDPTLLRANLDGVEIKGLEAHLQDTPPFTMVLPANGIGPEGSYPDALSRGYYLMLEPLPVGRHEFSFGGAVPGIFSAYADVTLFSVPEPATATLTVLTTLGVVVIRHRRRRNSSGRRI